MDNRQKLLGVILSAVLSIYFLPATCSRAAPPPTLPLTISESAWQPLPQIWDSGFQAELNRALERRGLWRSLIGSGKMAVAAVDLCDPGAPRFAQVNGNLMMYGASLPKLGILLAAFQGLEDGTLKEPPEMWPDLIKMIRRSDNPAAGRLTARIGLGKIEALLQDPRYRFYDAARGGGLWLGSGFAPGGERHPEPLQGLLQAATANQVCRFYYLLAYGRLVNFERSRQMLKILAFPDLHDKFVKVLEPSMPLSQLHRKSGEWSIWHSDSILVWGDPPWRRYILVCLVEYRQGERVLEELLPAVEQILRARSLETGWRHRQ